MALVRNDVIAGILLFTPFLPQAYIEKIMEKTDLTIDTTNWRRVTFIALAVALKVYYLFLLLF